MAPSCSLADDTHRVDPVWRSYERRDRRRVLRHEVAAVALIVAAFVSAARAASLLRWAHLYRQMSDEGNGFAAVARLLALSWVTAVASSLLLLRAAFMPFDGARRGLIWTAGMTLFVPLVATVAAAWVESYGDRCIAGC